MQISLILTQNISLFLVMLAFYFFYGDGTGHGGFWTHCSGYDA